MHSHGTKLTVNKYFYLTKLIVCTVSNSLTQFIYNRYSTKTASFPISWRTTQVILPPFFYLLFWKQESLFNCPFKIYRSLFKPLLISKHFGKSIKLVDVSGFWFYRTQHYFYQKRDFFRLLSLNKHRMSQQNTSEVSHCTPSLAKTSTLCIVYAFLLCPYIICICFLLRKKANGFTVYHCVFFLSLIMVMELGFQYSNKCQRNFTEISKSGKEHFAAVWRNMYFMISTAYFINAY